MNKKVNSIMLIKLLLCGDITENLFATSACGLTQSLPQTRGGETLNNSKHI